MKKEKSINVRLSNQQAKLLDLLVLHYQRTFKNQDLNASDIIRMALQDMADREIPWATKTK